MRLALALLVFGLFVQHGWSTSFPVRAERWVYRIGDDPTWRTSTLDDLAWKPLRGFDRDLAGTLYWLRGEIELPPMEDKLQPLVLAVVATASYEVWWDGHLIGRSGKVGNSRKREDPGPLDNAFFIPADLATPGSHTLAFRLSTFHKSKQTAGYLFIAEVVEGKNLTAIDFKSARRLPFLSLIFLVAVFYLLVFITDDRRPDTLWFALLCLGVAAMMIAESWRDLFGYSYDKHSLRLYTVMLFTALTGFLLSGFLVRRFFPEEIGRWTLLQGLVTIGGYFYSSTFDGRSMAIMFGTLGLSAVLVGRALRLKKRGSLFATSGIVICLVLITWNRYAFMDLYFFIAFGFLLLGLMIAQALELRARSRAKHDALLTAARLEIELLKKNIQPHFLLNTLTSLMEWLEEAPATGAKLVQALAEELRLLGMVANQSEISIEQELALCRAHLTVMGYRRDLRFSLVTDGIDPVQTVPPALFHTLLENGVTYHGGAPSKQFTLKKEQMPGVRRFIFTAPTTRNADMEREGTGIRYIKARLRERYPDRWKFTHGLVAGTWQTVIEIREA